MILCAFLGIDYSGSVLASNLFTGTKFWTQSAVALNQNYLSLIVDLECLMEIHLPGSLKKVDCTVTERKFTLAIMKGWAFYMLEMNEDFFNWYFEIKYIWFYFRVHKYENCVR